MIWIVLLSTLGILLICLEMFLPGMVVGSVGAICLVAGVVVTYVKFGFGMGNLALASLIILSAVALFVWMRIFPALGIGRSMVTTRDLGDCKSASALTSLMGKSGEAATILRPSGMAIIDGHRVDVSAEVGLIEKGSAVRVLRVEGNRVIVGRLETKV